MFYAAKSGRADVFDWLLNQKGIRTDLLDSYGKTALHWPVLYGHLEVIEVMGKHKLDVNIRSREGETLLHVAMGNIFSNAHGRHAKVVEMLLTLGTDPSLSDKNKRTPLFSAFTLVGKIDAAKVLLSGKRTGVHVRDRSGDTVLHHAIGWGSVEAVKLLIEHGADPSIRNEAGERPEDRLRIWKSMNQNPGKEDVERDIRKLLNAEQ